MTDADLTASDERTPLQRWLIDVRTVTGRSRSEMAAFLGISYGNYANIENGRSRVSDERLNEFGLRLGGIPDEVRLWQAERQEERPNRGVPRPSGNNKIQTPFTEWMKRARLRRGITQTALASLMGVRFSVVRNLERGYFLPSKENISALTLVFGSISDEASDYLARAGVEARFKSRSTPDTELPAFGRILRRLRRKHNLSQEELAEEIGFARKSGMIYLIEHGRRKANDAFLQKLADRFANGVIPTVWRDALSEEQSPLMRPKSSLSDIELPPLGECLSTLRRSIVGSRAELAAKIGLTQGDVQDIEFGSVPVTHEVLERIAAAFGFKTVPYEWERLRLLSNQQPSSEPLPRPPALSPFGHILRNERKARKMTLKAAADAVGVSAPFLHSLEYGRAMTVPERVIRLAALFGFERVPDPWIEALNLSCRSMIREGVLSPESPAAADWGPRIRAEESAKKSPGQKSG